MSATLIGNGGRQHLREFGWGWGLAVGIFLALVGIIAVVTPIVTTLTIALFLGVVVIAGGIIEFFGAFAMKRWGDLIGEAILAGLAMIAGYFLLRYPGASMATLTLILGWYFVVEGFFRLGLGMKMRPLEGWGRMVVNGLVTMLLGIVVLWQWPESSLWVIGTILGFKLLMNGISLVALSLLLKPKFPSSVH